LAAALLGRFLKISLRTKNLKMVAGKDFRSHKWKRHLAEQAILATPGKSDRLIAYEVGLSASYIRKVRGRLEREGRLAATPARRGRDNKWRASADLAVKDERTALLALAAWTFHANGDTMPSDDDVTRLWELIAKHGVRYWAHFQIRPAYGLTTLGRWLARFAHDRPDQFAEVKRTLEM
jgi:hypothetical protein